MSHNPQIWVILVFSIVLAVVLASPGHSPHHDFLQKRAVDTGCYSSCTEYSTLLSSPNCTLSITCVCEPNVVKALLDCCNCGVSLSSGAQAELQRQQLQSSLTSYAQACQILGVNVGNLTITATPNSVSTTATGCAPDVTDIFPTLFPF